MKKLSSLALMCLSFSCLYAQVDLPKNFLYLYSDSVISGNHIIYESWIDGSSHFIVDSKRIHPEQVKFFQNEMGFFANTRDLNFSGQASFTERIREGKLNLFEGRVSGSSAHLYYYPLNQSYGNDRRISLSFYNVGLGDLKKSNYKNLKVDLADNPKSMLHLAQYRKSRFLSQVLLYAGGAAIIGGAIVGFSATDSRDLRGDFFDSQRGSKTTSTIVSTGLVVGGLVSVGFSLSKSFKKIKYIKQAVDEYNYSK